MYFIFYILQTPTESTSQLHLLSSRAWRIQGTMGRNGGIHNISLVQDQQTTLKESFKSKAFEMFLRRPGCWF